MDRSRRLITGFGVTPTRVVVVPVVFDNILLGLRLFTDSPLPNDPLIVVNVRWDERSSNLSAGAAPD